MKAPYIEKAEPQDDYSVVLTFANGERRMLNMKPYLTTEVFSPLLNRDLFRQVRVVFGSLEWPGDRDLAYDSLYFESEPLS